MRAQNKITTTSGKPASDSIAVIAVVGPQQFMRTFSTNWFCKHQFLCEENALKIQIVCRWINCDRTETGRRSGRSSQRVMCGVQKSSKYKIYLKLNWLFSFKRNKYLWRFVVHFRSLEPIQCIRNRATCCKACRQLLEAHWTDFETEWYDPSHAK